MPASPRYRPAPLFATLGPEFADPVAAAGFPQLILRHRNNEWAARIGLDTLSPAEWLAHFGRFEPLSGNMAAPLAMRYHGHQFRTYNPNIGDGRGFLFAQVRDGAGRLLDLGTKGSGQTPYSRFGDGRLTLKGGVREVLAAAMLEARGVYTSKALSLIETGEALTRGDEPSPTRSSVLVRLSHSHIRFGSFQRLAYEQRPDLTLQLIEHVAEAYYPDLADAPDLPAALFGEIVEANALLAASWMAAGFVHGVLNTDNLNVTGESFDYGPWRFLPHVDPAFTAAYFDETGLYAYGRQAEAVSWALAQLGGAFLSAAPQEALEAARARFGPAYQAAIVGRTLARLGLPTGRAKDDLAFVQALFDWLAETRAPFDQFFHDWIGADAARAAASPEAARYADAGFSPIREGLEARATGSAPAHPYFQRPRPVSLVIDEVEAVWAPIAARDDWSAFDAKLEEIAELAAAEQLGRHANVASEA